MSRRVALLIGNNEHDDALIGALRTPQVDVEEFAELLRSPDIGGFDEVSLSIDQPCDTVRRRIADLFADRSREDVLLLYFSGHGIKDIRGRLYLTARDTRSNRLNATALPASFIADEMDLSRSTRQVLILDCCYSGAFARGAKAATGNTVSTADAFQGNGSGRFILTATDETEYAWEGDQLIDKAVNSAFTHFLLQGIRNGAADADGDGAITLDELYSYIAGRMAEETPQQTPGRWSYRQQRGGLLIARNPHATPRPLPLPPELQGAIENPFAAVREAAVRELERLLRSSQKGLALAAEGALQQLAHDDSRRVSAAAGEALKAAPQPAPPPTPSRPLSPAESDAPSRPPGQLFTSTTVVGQGARVAFEQPTALADQGDTRRILDHYNYNEALADLNHSLELQPNDAWALGMRGQAYAALGRYDESLADLNRSLELQPESARALRRRGDTYRMLNRHDEALADLTRSLQLQPDHAWALGTRGKVHAALGRYDEALVDLNRSLELQPNVDWVFNERNRIQRKLNPPQYLPDRTP